MRTVHVVLVVAILGATDASLAMAQASISVRDVSSPVVTSVERFQNIFTVIELPNGHVLLNDGIARRVVELDNNLATRKTVLDSSLNGGNSYGPVAAPLIRYLADSTLFVDGISLALLVIDPTANVSRTATAPSRADFRFLAGASATTDSRGNLIYRITSISPMVPSKPGADGSSTIRQEVPDSAALVRANFETRIIDTVARLRQQSGTRGVATRTSSGKMSSELFINPLDAIDEWALMSNGSIAILRGHDYHVDVIRQDGTKVAGPKLPYDWHKLTDSDKTRIRDSLQMITDSLDQQARETGNDDEVTNVLVRTVSKYSSGLGSFFPLLPAASPSPSAAVKSARLVGEHPKLTFVAAKEMPDYAPPFRSGALNADYNEHVWILPSSTSSSLKGELIYDVIDGSGVLVYRVRLPIGRSVVGFGASGNVYLMSRDGPKGWRLERVRMLY